MLPVHVEPVQVLPVQVEPVHDAWSKSPTTVRSPVRCSPWPFWRTKWPRSPSSDPVPSDQPWRWMPLMRPRSVVGEKSSWRSRTPCPAWRAGASTGTAELVMMAFASSGVRSSRASRRLATTPAVKAVACDVPLPRRPPSTIASGFPSAMAASGARPPRIERPGATTSGERPREPTADQDGTVARCRSPGSTSRVSAAPTAMTHGLIAGVVSRPSSAPWLPAATATVMPWRHAASTA